MGLGLLNCQGLNRALLLPAYFAQNYPSPDYIFAPNPSVKATEIHGDGLRHDYVRPLRTIAPTAVQLGVPINTQLPFNDPGLLADVLLSPKYHDAVVFVAWEHMNIVTFAKIMNTRFASTEKIPTWPNSDYDTVFVFNIKWSDVPAMELVVNSEGIKSLSNSCPLGLTDTRRNRG